MNAENNASAAAISTDRRNGRRDIMMKSPFGAIEASGRLKRKGRDDLCGREWYIVCMTKLVEEALRQIEQLPPSDQDAAAGAMLDYVKHMRDMRLTDEQLAEVRRRRTTPDRKLLSHAEARERISRLGL
jgi:hypothetical protein